ncbi:hypothetical protein MKX03_008829 [Papaver bracteatum]|nr:hypothetical protein MKX03_008829 [Papaver bracteatum]
MKLSPQQQSLNLVLCSLILIISCISMISMDVHCIVVVNHDQSSDQLALLAFKIEITEDPLGILSSWNDKNDSLHFCEWRGVTCSRSPRSRRVIMLDLSSQGLVGSISPHIGNLSFLMELILQNNSLNGDIPQQIGRLSRLTRLGLSNNSLEGEIPKNISGCSNLIQLNISRNNLLGSIPNELGYLPHLEMIQIYNNHLSGEIPTSLGNLSSLIFLSFWNNNLEGRIPNTLGQLTNLKLLSLISNRLSGIVPPSLYNISSLEAFTVSLNQLHGRIPFDIGFTLPNLKHFSLGVNHFTGTIPSSFSNLSNLESLQLQVNSLVGSVPSNLGNLKNLEILQLGVNKLGSGQANDLDFLNSLINCTKLRWLIIADNSFGGVLPSSITNLTTNLDILDFSMNQIYGSIPPGIQNLLGITRLHFGSNQFTGSIPPGIGLLQNLGILSLENNKITGSIPTSLGNLTQLIQLYLFGNSLTGLIPTSLGNCESLQKLDFYSNKLSGSIPKQIFKLSSLTLNLDLSQNSFTGSLPVEVGNLKHLGELYLDGNKLYGEIPSAIGECSNLKVLNLSSNILQGNIPQSLTFLKGLEWLNLSHNNLSGVIPKGFKNLKFFLQMDLAFNNLEGEVPEEGVFLNLSALSITGNNKLCGGVPELKLQNCSKILLNSDTKRKQRKSVINKVTIIITIVVVLVLSLVVFCLIVYWTRKSKTKLPSTALDVGNQYMGISYNELLKATNGFNDSTNLLGAGSFGPVYKGILREDTSKPAAVKVLHLQQRGATKSFMAECDALRKVRHRNFLKIITCCSSTDFQGNDFKALVFELTANGSLEDWLHPNEGDTTNLNLERRLSIAVDVASALNYLHHDFESPIAHCDLKPSNILLDDDLTAHVGDFGLAKFLSNHSRQLNEKDASSIAINGSIGYVSPEYGMGGEVSTQGDVYSYGILLLEMVTGKRPTDDIFKDGLNIHSYCKMHAFPERVLDIIDSRLLLELEGEHHEDNKTRSNNMPQSERRNGATHTTRQILASIIQIGVKCSSELPSDRISMSEVIVDVQAVKNQIAGIRK